MTLPGKTVCPSYVVGRWRYPFASLPRIITTMRNAIAIVLLLVGLGGCARYDFQVLKPDALSTRITETASRVQTPNMVYLMQAYEGRLVMQLHNKEATPAELLGEKSFVVDPAGVSHPLRSLTIAPDSYAKLVLPPLRPRFDDHRFNFGVSSQASHLDRSCAIQPVYLDVYADTDAFYWDWDGNSPIRMLLTYRKAGGTEVADEFTIGKVTAH